VGNLLMSAERQQNRASNRSMSFASPYFLRMPVAVISLQPDDRWNRYSLPEF
jgi:hypothetical protein